MAVMNISYKSESNSTNYANGTKMIHRLCQPISSQRSLFIPSEKIRKPFQDGGRYHIETSPLICGAKSGFYMITAWTGFYMITPSVLKWLNNICVCLLLKISKSF